MRILNKVRHIFKSLPLYGGDGGGRLYGGDGGGRFSLEWGEIIDSLSRNKARTLLTAFGIFWGIFMLMLLMGGGKGLQESLGRLFAGFASNAAFVFPDKTSEPYGGFQSDRSWNMDLDDVERLRRQIPEIDIVAPIIIPERGTATYGDKKSSITIKSYTPEYNEIENVPIKEGRLLNAADDNQRRKVCIIGKRNATELFGDSISAIGKYIDVHGIKYQVVGVNDKGDGINIGGNPMSTIYLPYSTLIQIYNRGRSIDFIGYTVKPGATVSDVQEKVNAVIRKAHHISPKDTKAVQTFNTEAIFSVIDGLFNGISILVWMIGLGTLISGAIGVSNIMLVTVKERTSEIGIRRAIGATPRDILVQTMTESIVLTLVAGMCGISFAVLCLAGIETASADTMNGANFQVPFGTAIGAALFLGLLGILAGTGPTLRAMSIKPVDAMREE